MKNLITMQKYYKFFLYTLLIIHILQEKNQSHNKSTE